MDSIERSSDTFKSCVKTLRLFLCHNMHIHKKNKTISLYKTGLLLFFYCFFESKFSEFIKIDSMNTSSRHKNGFIYNFLVILQVI